MDESWLVQGRTVSAADVAAVRDLIASNPGWSRYKLSRVLCEIWDWRDPKGQIKDMAARALLGKFEQRGWIQLPAKRMASPNRMRHKRVMEVEHDRDPIRGCLSEIGPVQVRELGKSPRELPLFEHLLAAHHYLGYRSAVGLNLKYLVVDRQGRPLGCLLFGSAAWKCSARDEFIGWSASERQRRLQQVTNNTRFLILPWVQVRHLASHILSLVLRRVVEDWRAKYARSLDLIETFVDTRRFQGVCYQAANWICVGETTGRTRQDQWKRIQVAPKRVFVYPLHPGFRQGLRA